LYSTTIYYAESFNTQQAAATSRTALTVTVNTLPSVPSAIADQVIYGSGSVIIPGVPNGGDQIRWFTNITDTTPLYTGSRLLRPR